jgi:spore germination protein GerM
VGTTAPRTIAGTAAAAMLALAGCGLTPSRPVEEIDPLGLPTRLVATPSPTAGDSAAQASAGGSVYFLGDDQLVRRPRTLSAAAGAPAIQQLLDALAAGPDDADRDGGISTALPPATVLRLTRLDGDVATVDLRLDQLPPDQTVAIAQIVLTVTSLTEASGVRLSINGEPIGAPLASGAQTDRPVTRSDYSRMLAELR